MYLCFSDKYWRMIHLFFVCSEIHSSADDNPWQPVSWIEMSNDDKYFPMRFNLLKIIWICLNSHLLFHVLSNWKIFSWTGCTLSYRILVISFSSLSDMCFDVSCSIWSIFCGILQAIYQCGWKNLNQLVYSINLWLAARDSINVSNYIPIHSGILLCELNWD